MGAARVLGVGLGLALNVTAGCGGGPGGGADGGTGDDAGGSMPEPAPPMPPREVELPVLTPCPPGWEERIDEYGIALCDPWPGGGTTDCPGADEARFVGERGCTRIGDPCPADGWPAGLPPGAPVVYARAGAPPGGDGSTAAPFDTLSGALSAAPAGAIVALAPGDYTGGLSLRRDVTLWGACVAGTAIDDGAGAPAVVTVPRGVEATFRNLRIGPATTRGVRSLGTAVLRDVLVRETTESAVLAETAGTVELENVAIGGTVVGDVPGLAAGVRVAPGGSARARRALIGGGEAFGVVVAGQATLEDTSIRDLRCAGESGGAGIAVHGDGALTASRLAIGRTCEHGVFVVDAGQAVIATSETSSWAARGARSG